MKTNDPLTPQLVFGEAPILKEPRIIGNWVLWLEQRPKEKGRTTALIRPWKSSEVIPKELTPFPIDLRTRVHGYGGNPLSFSQNGNEIVLTWIDNVDGCLWTQKWFGFEQEGPLSPENLYTLLGPICLSLKSNCLFADGLIDKRRDRWIGVMELNGKDFIVAFSLKEENKSPEILYSAKDFLGYLSVSPNGNQIAWVEWQMPFMPWDSNYLYWAKISLSGDFLEIRNLISGVTKSGKNKSVFQPIWASNGELFVSEDIQGWWNLIYCNPELDNQNDSYWQKPWLVKGEMGRPQWVFGMSTHSCIGNEVVSSICENGSWRLAILSKNGFIKTIRQPFNDIEGLYAQDDQKVVAIASNSFNSQGILELDLKDGSWLHSSALKNPIHKDKISIAEPFWFNGFQGKKVHAWYYPPINRNECVPILVKNHSGPTGMASRGLSLEIQFWTSRGWGVLDVNYGGSTGFGREYRERLKMNWGVVDVWDCAKGAQKLIDCGIADKKRIAIEGSSASGLTTLACLCFTNIFSVAACRYAVSDLNAMLKSTHRFEAHYLNYLVGDLDTNQNNYLNRSPINHAEKIDCPVILFHGLKDKVVSSNQSIQIKNILEKNNIPVELHTFKDEGHGFRNGSVKVEVLSMTEKFFRKHLNI